MPFAVDQAVTCVAAEVQYAAYQDVVVAGGDDLFQLAVKPCHGTRYTGSQAGGVVFYGDVVEALGLGAVGELHGQVLLGAGQDADGVAAAVSAISESWVAEGFFADAPQHQSGL